MKDKKELAEEINQITEGTLKKLPQVVEAFKQGRIRESIPTYEEAMEPYLTLIDNPHKGKVELNKKYKYKDICKLFGEEVLEGRSRYLQIESWESYYHFEKNGIWLIPTEEYEKVLNLPDGRGRRASYSDILGNLLSVLLYKSFASTVDTTPGLYYLTIPKTYLYIILGFFNKEFIEYSYHPVKQDYESNFVWNQFAAEVFKKSDDMLSASLKDLKRKTLCRYKEVDELYIEYEGKKMWVELSDGFGVHLDSVKAGVISSLGCKSVKEIFQKQMGSLYHDSVCNVFTKLTGAQCFGFRSSIKIMAVQWRVNNLIRRIFSDKQYLVKQLKDEIILELCNQTVPKINKIMVDYLEDKTEDNWDKLCKRLETDRGDIDILTEVCLNTSCFSDEFLYKNPELMMGDVDEEQMIKRLISLLYNDSGKDEYDVIRHLWVRKFISFNQESWRKTISGNVNKTQNRVFENPSPRFFENRR